jgi:hypothetical protein
VAAFSTLTGRLMRDCIICGNSRFQEGEATRREPSDFCHRKAPFHLYGQVIGYYFIRIIFLVTVRPPACIR